MTDSSATPPPSRYAEPDEYRRVDEHENDHEEPPDCTPLALRAPADERVRRAAAMHARFHPAGSSIENMSTAFMDSSARCMFRVAARKYAGFNSMPTPRRPSLTA